jgi:hypothetical protein
MLSGTHTVRDGSCRNGDGHRSEEGEDSETHSAKDSEVEWGRMYFVCLELGYRCVFSAVLYL